MRLLVLAILGVCAKLIQANTETYLLSIPYYYNILPHSDPYVDQQHLPISINSTHQYLYDFPIYNFLTYGKHNNLVHISQTHVPMNTLNVLYVKMNNYEDSIFSSKNSIYCKLCWPSSSPYRFRISHEFMDDDLALYLVIAYQFEGVPNKAGTNDLDSDLEFFLYASSLLKVLPIPIELYTTIAYLVDVGIILYCIVPWIVKGYFSV